jgi:hypothetical protein
MSEFGIVLFGHSRPLVLADTLEALKLQDALPFVDLWVDGYQGIVDLKNKVELTHKIADSYEINIRRYHRGQLGFRKLILLAMQSAVNNYEHILFLEDDCFPSRNAVRIFREELEFIENDSSVFSVYGHPFLMAEDGGYCNRFQGWGWATTAEKLAPYVEEMISLYSATEQDYLDFVERTLTDELLQRLDVTPPRQPSYTLRSFFAWDETLALLTARDHKKHKLAKERVIYNCGIGADASRFAGDQFFKPPFNLVLPEDVWSHY